MRVSTDGNVAADINAAISLVAEKGGGAVYLPALELRLGGAIILKSGVELIGHRRGTVFKPTFTGSVDDPTNACIKAEGTAGASTTLSVLAAKDSTQITVASAAGLAIGDYLQIFGTNNALTNSADDSDGSSVVLYEIVQIAGIAGSVLTLAWPTTQYHASTVAVRKWTPVTKAGVFAIEIDAAGGSVATGLLARGTIGLRVDEFTMRGASRSMVELDQGTRDFRLRGLYADGEVNSIVHAVSAMHGSLEAESSSTGTRFHASGIPRGLLTFRQRCTDITVRSANLRRGCVGIVIAGGKHLKFGTVHISDMDTDRAYAQWQSPGEFTAGAQLGGGIHMGYGPLPFAEVSHDVSFETVSVENVRHASAGLEGCSALLHDCHDLGIRRLAVRNHGHADTGILGVTAADVAGKIDHLDVAGVTYGLRTLNAFANLKIDDYGFNGSPGTGSQQPIALRLGHTLPLGGPRIKNMGIGNAAGSVRFDAGFADPYVFIDTYTDETSIEFGRSCVAYNNTGGSFSRGDLVEIAGTVTVNGQAFLSIITPTGANRRLAVVTVGAGEDIGTGFMMVAELPTAHGYVTVRSADAVAIGDLLEGQNASREAAKNNSSTAPIGRARSTKSGGGGAAIVAIGIV